MTLSKRSKQIAVCSLLALAAAVLFFTATSRKKGAETTGVVTRQELVQRVTIAGTIVSKRRTLVAAPYNGYVRQIFVEVGDKIKPGQPLVSVAQSLQSAEPVFPLRAPYAGTVVHVQKHEGEYVKEADTEYILRIDDLSQFYVQANAPEIDRAKLLNGLEAVIKASAVPTRSYKGKITELTLAPQAASQSGGSRNQGGEYPVRIEILDADSKIGPGMSAVVDIITHREPNVLTLRHEFVVRDESGFFVIMADGQKRKIEIGLQNEDVVQVRSGLSEKDEVRQVDFTDLAEPAKK